MFHLDFKLLRSFAAVAEERSVTRAAERLRLTQPTVSGQIRELEREVGFVLFHRSTRRIELSERGEQMLPFVRSVLAEAERLRIEVEDMQMAKTLAFRLGAAMYTLDFDDRITLFDAFAVAHPDIRYVVDNRLQCAQVVDLLNSRLDAALVLGVPASMAAGDENSRALEEGLIVNETVYPEHLEHVVLRRRRIGLLVPDDGALARFEVVPREALAGTQIAMLSREHGAAFIQPIADFLTAAGAAPLFLSEGNALAIERYAARQRIPALGIGWFPLLPGMTLKPVEGMSFALELAVVLGAAPNKAARRFFAFAKAWQAARGGVGGSGGGADGGQGVPVGDRGAVALQ